MDTKLKLYWGKWEDQGVGVLHMGDAHPLSYICAFIYGWLPERFLNPERTDVKKARLSGSTTLPAKEKPKDTENAQKRHVLYLRRQSRITSAGTRLPSRVHKMPMVLYKSSRFLKPRVVIHHQITDFLYNHTIWPGYWIPWFQQRFLLNWSSKNDPAGWLYRQEATHPDCLER